jgi:hypothetical protein
VVDAFYVGTDKLIHSHVMPHGDDCGGGRVLMCDTMWSRFYLLTRR